MQLWAREAEVGIGMLRNRLGVAEAKFGRG